MFSTKYCVFESHFLQWKLWSSVILHFNRLKNLNSLGFLGIFFHNFNLFKNKQYIPTFLCLPCHNRFIIKHNNFSLSVFATYQWNLSLGTLWRSWRSGICNCFLSFWICFLYYWSLYSYWWWHQFSFSAINIFTLISLVKMYKNGIRHN